MSQLSAAVYQLHEESFQHTRSWSWQREKKPKAKCREVERDRDREIGRVREMGERTVRPEMHSGFLILLSSTLYSSNKSISHYSNSKLSFCYNWKHVDGPRNSLASA